MSKVDVNYGHTMPSLAAVVTTAVKHFSITDSINCSSSFCPKIDRPKWTLFKSFVVFEEYKKLSFYCMSAIESEYQECLSD